MTDIRVSLSVRDLAHEDLPSCDWSGSAMHVRQIAEQLRRAEVGEVDYLAVCGPADVPVAIGGVDYMLKSGAGTLWQLGVHPALQSCGIGTLLISAAEARITARGLAVAELGVEESNPRAQLSTSDWATGPTAASWTPGTWRLKRVRSSGTKPCAR